VWHHIDPGAEPAATPADRFLHEAATAFLIDPSEGRSPFLYPRTHELTRLAEESGREQLLAAWLYLHHRVGPDRLRQLPEAAKRYVDMGLEVVSRLVITNQQVDREQANQIEDQVITFEAAEAALGKQADSLLRRLSAHARIGNDDRALQLAQKVTTLLEEALRSVEDQADQREERNESARKLADCYGREGGIYRRKGRLQEALESYRKGRDIEQDPKYEITDSYNLTNSLVIPILLDPGNLEAIQGDFLRAAEIVNKQVRGKRRDQWWAWADLGLLALLSRQPELALRAYQQYPSTGARSSDYASTIAVLQQCHDRLEPMDPGVASSINQAILFLRAGEKSSGATRST
jgi:tetratricopeptide (TPR) repeat protein